MKKPTPLSEFGPFQFIIFALSIFVLGLIAIDLLLDLPDETARVLAWVDNVVCGLFFIDFAIRFHRAESKRAFMKWGWIDLLASIPTIDTLRWGRLFRICRFLRILRVIKSLRLLIGLFFRDRTGGGIASIFTITFLVVSLSAAGILLVERDPASNIRTAEDAVWWSVTTVTTVGYGDRYPVTPRGRLIAGALMLTGVGLFGTLSGVIASFFLGEKKTETAASHEELLARLDVLQREIAALRHHTPATTPSRKSDRDEPA